MSFEVRRGGICLVVAYARQRVIGRDGAMPWHLPEDLMHFKALTLHATVIMGRKTFESIGRALPQRHNIVISRDPTWQHDQAFHAGNLEDAISIAGSGEIFVIGGGQIYALALPLADRAVVTEIELSVAGDAYFPELSPSNWEAVSHINGLSGQGLAYRIIDYRRIKT